MDEIPLRRERELRDCAAVPENQEWSDLFYLYRDRDLELVFQIRGRDDDDESREAAETRRQLESTVHVCRVHVHWNTYAEECGVESI